MNKFVAFVSSGELKRLECYNLEHVKTGKTTGTLKKLLSEMRVFNR